VREAADTEQALAETGDDLEVIVTRASGEDAGVTVETDDDAGASDTATREETDGAAAGDHLPAPVTADPAGADTPADPPAAETTTEEPVETAEVEAAPAHPRAADAHPRAGVLALRPSRRLLATIVAAVVLLAVVSGADAWLRHRRVANLQTVTAAYADKDCGRALEAWRQAGQDPALPGRREVPSAEVRKAVADCRALAAADRLAGEGDAGRAFAAYLALRRTSPTSPLADDVVGSRLVAVLDRRDVAAEPGLCRDLRGAVDAGILTRDDAVPQMLTACGELLAESRGADDRVTAFVLVSAVREDYPKAPEAPAAATVEAELRLAVAQGAPHAATTPFQARSAPSGDASVRFVNHAPWPVTLTVAGPGGGRVVSLPACPDCGPYLEDISWHQCMGKGRATTLTLPPGRFEVALQYSGDGPDPSHGFWQLQPGAYEECYFFTR
jgi:hypothetical protein